MNSFKDLAQQLRTGNNVLIPDSLDGDINGVIQGTWIDAGIKEYTALAAASHHGLDNAVARLIELGANPNLSVKSLSEPRLIPPIELAIRSGKRTVVEILSPRVKPGLKVYKTCVSLAAEGGAEMLDLLVKGREREWAAHKQDIALAYLILSGRDDPTGIATLSKMDASPLSFLDGGNPVLFELIMRDVPGWMDAFDRHREAALELRNNCGQSVLHVAAMSGNSRSIEHLLRAGADCTIEDEMGNRPGQYSSAEHRHLFEGRE